MYRLAQLDDNRRRRIGWALLALGFITLVVGVLWVHYTALPPEEDAGFFNWVPRHHLLKGVGYLVVLAASQMLLAGALFVWVLNQTMTWARAVFAAFIAWVELVLVFGMVPSEWLNFAQTDLDWSSQRTALVIPTWLVLGNEVAISWAAIKDSISMGYHIVMLGAGAVFAIQLQKMKQGPPPSAEKPPVRSPYGRPLVRGEG